MTVEQHTGTPPYVIAGTGPYPIIDPYAEAAAIVARVEKDGVLIDLISGDDFSVFPLVDAPDGDLTLSAAAAASYAGCALYIERETTIEQGWEGILNAREKGMEAQLDRNVMVLQELRQKQSRTFKVLGASAPELVPENGRVIGWDGGGPVMGPTFAAIAAAEDSLSEALAAAQLAMASAGLNVSEFHDWQYITDMQQLAYVRGGNIEAQDEVYITARMQAMHQAAMDHVKAGGAALTNFSICLYSGIAAINDEMFSEAFAQDLHDLPETVDKFAFVGVGIAEVRAKNWLAVARVRTSGIWAGTADPVPTAMFRWEQSKHNGNGPIIQNLRLRGNRDTGDPIGIKTFRANKLSWQDVVILNFANIGKMHEGIVNSDEWNTVVEGCGYEPTKVGGASGFTTGTVRFSATGGGGTTAIVATEDVFDATHVGRVFMVVGAGAGGNIFAATIASVADARNAVLAEACSVDVVDAGGSFEAITCTTVAGDPNVVVETLPTGVDMVGRYVSIVKGGHPFAELDTHVSRVIAQAGDTITLNTAPANSVADTVITIAHAELVGFTDDYIDFTDGGTRINDYQVWGQRNENPHYQGNGSAPNALFMLCDNVTYSGGKSHGNPPENNFGSNAYNTLFDGCWNMKMPNYAFEWGHYHGALGALTVTGNRSFVMLRDIVIGNASCRDDAAHFRIDPKTPDVSLCKVGLSGLDKSGSGWPADGQQLVRYGANGSVAHFDLIGPFIQENVAPGANDQPPMRVRTAQAYDRITVGKEAEFDHEYKTLTYFPTAHFPHVWQTAAAEWAGYIDGSGDYNFGYRIDPVTFRFAWTIDADAVADGIRITSSGVEVKRLKEPGLPTFANNAEALAAGRVEGEGYLVAGTDPRLRATVFTP